MSGPELIVKLGGSQFGAGLRPWLAAIAAARGPVVLVPGGGAFAEAVRAAQAPMGFDDRAAHAMALLAMAQSAIALASLSSRLEPAGSTAEIRAALDAGKLPVWSPWPMLRDAPDVAQSWDVTSDSLALWLAIHLGAARVLLVKPRRPDAPPEAEPAGAGAMWAGMPAADEAIPAPAEPRACGAAMSGPGALVDAAFAGFAARYDGDIFIAGPLDAPAALDPLAPPGQRIRAARKPAP